MLPKLEQFYSFIEERESIRLRKLSGVPAPWTTDPILSQYKFTNVRRKHDKTTQKLIEMFYDKVGQKSPMDVVLFNCALFRYFGTWEFAEALGWQDDFRPKEIIKLARRRLNCKERVFTGAYIITNTGLFGPKEEIVVNVFLKNLWDNRVRITQVVEDTNSWEKTAAVLSTIQGFGGSGFMGKETLLDTMHCRFWKKGLPSDYWDWTPIGPGARRGINRVMDCPPETRRSDKEMLEIILEITKLQDSYWPKDWGKLAPTDQQFQLCEFDKYSRTLNGEGRPRSRYIAK